MDPQALELSKTSARASLPYAGGLAVALGLFAWIPCLGCIVWLAVVFGGPVAIGYLITPKLQNFPAGQSKGMLALYIGLGIGAALAAAFAVGSLVSGILGLILGSAVAALLAEREPCSPVRPAASWGSSSRWWRLSSSASRSAP